jgi:hypothetical protein
MIFERNHNLVRQAPGDERVDGIRSLGNKDRIAEVARDGTGLASPLHRANLPAFQEQNHSIFVPRSHRTGHALRKRNIPDRNPLIIDQRCRVRCSGEKCSC